MDKEALKRQAAEAALAYVEEDQVIGVGTGSTVNHFIDLLSKSKRRVRGAVSSSEASTQLLRKAGIEILDLNSAGPLPVYVDGADEADAHLRLIKGGGGALTREKIIAAASERFVCIVDESKCVDVLGNFPLPVEVIPLARSFVARELAKLGGQPEWRQGFVTDNGNPILDVRNLKISDPVKVEEHINGITGVVTVGLFARRSADVLLIASATGVKKVER